MDIEGWIWTCILGGIVAILAVKLLKTSLFYFEPMDLSQVVEKPLVIPANGISLHGKAILPRFALDGNAMPRERLPAIIFSHGWGAPSDTPLMRQYGAAMSLGGPFAVIMYDCRGFGKSPGKPKLDDALFDDIPKVIDFVLGLDYVDPNRVGFGGVSLGGEIALARAYPDPRIKAIVGLCALHNARDNFSRKPRNVKERIGISFLNSSGVHGDRLPIELNQKISPEYVLRKDDPTLNGRVMLVQAKDDLIVPVDEFEKNRKVLDLSPDSILLLERGGHTFMRQELLVLSSVLRFFKAKL